MKVLHLSEKEAMNIASGYAQSYQGKAHESAILWSLIKEIQCAFPSLTWREDKKCFSKGV